MATRQRRIGEPLRVGDIKITRGGEGIHRDHFVVRQHGHKPIVTNREDAIRIAGAIAAVRVKHYWRRRLK